MVERPTGFPTCLLDNIMDLKSIINKFTEGTKLLLVQPTMFFRELGDVSLKTMHTVTEDEAGRPDLIADKYYGDHRMVDIILKYNNISDPFSIDEGEEIKIPKPFIAYYRLDRPKFAESTNAVKNQFIDTKRLTKKDQRRVEALKKKYGKDELLPPNVIPTGKKTYEFDGGLIRMGKQAQTAPVTQSTTLADMAAANAAGGLNSAPENAADLLNVLDSNVVKTDTNIANNTNTGANNTNTGTKADITGGNNFDGGNPQGTNTNTNSVDPDSPCSK